MLALGFASPTWPPALFRARIVPMALSRDTVVNDARRDGRAVGRTSEYTLDSRSDRSFVLFGGKSTFGAGPGDAHLVSEPVKIVGREGFLVAFRSWNAAGIFDEVARYRRGRVVGDRIVLGSRATGLDARSSQSDFGSPVGIAYPRAFWPRTEQPEWSHFPHRVQVRWAHLRRGVVVGFTSSVAQDAEGEPGSPCDPYRTALVKEGGRVSLLASRTIDAPRAGFGKIVWVSREGWLIVTAGQKDGLAWLEPIVRR